MGTLIHTDPLSRFYRHPALIATHGRVSFYATHKANTGEPRVLLVPERHADLPAVARAFEKIVHAHRMVAGGAMPAIGESGELDGVPYLTFACDGVTDLGGALDHLSAQQRKVPYAVAMAFVTDLMSTLRRAHAFGENGQPLAIGSLSWSNVLIGPSGQHWIIGLGHNFATHDEHGEPLPTDGIYQAPEVAAGGLVSPGGDLFAVVQLARSLMPFAELPPPLERIFRGQPLPEDQPLVELFTWSAMRILVAAPEERPRMDEAISNYARVWKLLGIQPSLGDLRQLLADAVAHDRIQTTPPPPERTLVVGPDCDWVSVDGGSPITIRTRRALRRICLALAKFATESPGATMDVTGLLDAGWPGEHPLPDAGANRVYVAVSTLRKMGLKNVIQRSAEGYRIDPRVLVRFVEREVSIARVG